MPPATTNLRFTPALHQFLVSESYGYIIYKGIQNEASKKDSIEQDEYILVPSKLNLSLKFEDTDLRVEKIDSMDVLEMLEYTTGIDFWVELPKEMAEKYLG
jgi:hypothetical protein